ncbi:MAG: ATP-dependent zinc metalloprotease FtsH, partial [Gemmatimonadota bacterium]|nr:ATP-dependent zinc metalloprotease FtsH [Gemmatimonadota bacterium]
VQDLMDSGVVFDADLPPSGLLNNLLVWLLPLAVFIGLWFVVLRRAGGGVGGPMSMGKSKAKEISAEMTGLTFSDVGGIDEVERELKEVIDFLKNPQRYSEMGAKLPTGILLMGPPGTGKTLLAKATAGEAGVPFFSISGSEFVELFVGVGASRVRDLFDQAKERAPCIVFIDEIDAIGQMRAGPGVLRTNDEREQTLNQLLYEMDGFEASEGVVILAATNRPDVLDRALLRAGRFDRQIEVPLPTEAGRSQILGIHARLVPLAADADVDRIAQITSSFSGADLANLINEAALMAVRRGAERVEMRDLDLAMERIVAGLERDAPLRGEVREKVAYHEGGHALVSQVLPNTDQLHRVSIIPTSKGALGYTMEMPEEDRYLMSEGALKERLAVLLGGRAAEVQVFGEISTGAANDLERATELARRMVTEFGMSELLGPVRYAGPGGAGYLEPAFQLRTTSAETESLIDKEVRRLIEEAERLAAQLLRSNEAALHEIARVLQEDEVLKGAEVARIVEEAHAAADTDDAATAEP